MKLELKSVQFNFLLGDDFVAIYYVPFFTENKTQLFSCRIVYKKDEIDFCTKCYPNKTNSVKLIKTKLERYLK